MDVHMEVTQWKIFDAYMKFFMEEKRTLELEEGKA